MQRIVLALSFLLALTASGQAQERDSVFEDYADYDAFLDAHIMGRDFGPLILRLGGRDEYTTEELGGIVGNFTRIYPTDLTGKIVFNQEAMGDGMRREARGYYNDKSYIWFYAIMHQRPEGGLVIINFRLNASIGPIMQAF